MGTERWVFCHNGRGGAIVQSVQSMGMSTASGIGEGFNPKTKLAIRQAYGFRIHHGSEVALYHSIGKLPKPDFN